MNSIWVIRRLDLNHQRRQIDMLNLFFNRGLPHNRDLAEHLRQTLERHPTGRFWPHQRGSVGHLSNADQTNTDSDANGNACDDDDDNDGLSDVTEAELGTDPLNRDSDGDGWSDGEEIAEATDPLDSTSQPEVQSSLPIWLLYHATQN